MNPWPPRLVSLRSDHCATTTDPTPTVAKNLRSNRIQPIFFHNLFWCLIKSEYRANHWKAKFLGLLFELWQYHKRITHLIILQTATRSSTVIPCQAWLMQNANPITFDLETTARLIPSPQFLLRCQHPWQWWAQLKDALEQDALIF